MTLTLVLIFTLISIGGMAVSCYYAGKNAGVCEERARLRK